MAPLRITPPEEGRWIEVRPQMHGDRRVAGHLKIIEQTPERVVVYTRYDPGLVIERHSHLSNEVIFVIEGELQVDGEACPAGTTLVLEKGTPFGPIEAGSEGAVIFESFDGETGHISEDYEGFLRLIEERGITLLPETEPDLPAQGEDLKSRS
ncbi:MAG: cupin domain-containing protein [Deltaproteobacteria bacterium]|jgi:hypothetical protein|nr:cupin domain-containing protein [Deltaproteobacteria bacterium]